jgi:hypothetical protein
MSAQAARALRERVAGSDRLALRIDRGSLLESMGPSMQREEEPDLYINGMLVHEGLRADAATDDGGAVELRLDPGLAVAGALWTTAAVLPVATIAFWVYGVLVALTGGAVAWGIRRWWPVIARTAPRFVPRGRLLGALAAGAAIAVLAAAVIYPIREIRRPDYLDAAPPAVAW